MQIELLLCYTEDVITLKDSKMDSALHRWMWPLHALVAGLILLTALAGCNGDRTHSQTVKAINVDIAVAPQPVSAPVYIAHEKGFFQQEGLHATLQPYSSGKNALNAVTRGKAHFGTVAETPIMVAGLKGEKVCIIATVADSDKYMKIIARKDRGISVPADLKGKKIGVSPGTNGEFFLHIYLTMNRLSQKDVQPVAVGPDDIVDALVTGKVDAVSTWVPYTTIVGKKLGSNALILEDPSIYTATWNIATTQDFVKRHPEHARRFLRAVLRANSFIKEHPGEARDITARRIGMDMSMLEEIWDMYNFNISLDDGLILNLEDQARWMKKKDASSGKIPNFMGYVYSEGLKTVRPEAVRIVD